MLKFVALMTLALMLAVYGVLKIRVAAHSGGEHLLFTAVAFALALWAGLTAYTAWPL